MHVTRFATVAAPGHENEDFVGATPTALVLLDGAGAGGNGTGCRHGVAWYARQLGAALLSELDAAMDKPLTAVLAAGIECVAGLHRHDCDLAHPATPSATAVMIRQRAEHLEYLVLADSTLVIDTVDALEVITDNREAIIGELYRGPMDAAVGGSPEHTEARLAYIAQLLHHRNRAGGFWVAAATPEVAVEAIVGTR